MKTLSAHELRVLESQYPPRLTGDMCDVGRCLFEAQLLDDPRMGTDAPQGEWLEQLQLAAGVVMVQLQHLANEMGGKNAYIAKGVMVMASEKYKRIYAEFTGHNHHALARQYNLTPMRIYQIVAAMRLAEFKARQQELEL